MTEVDWNALREAARGAARNAYTPYSHFAVGAAGLTGDGRVVTGCNIENASYGLTLCAECSLVAELINTGGGRLIAVAIIGGPHAEAVMPCGRCRQVLFEFGGPELLIDGDGTLRSLDSLLPFAFGPNNLQRISDNS